MGRACRINGRNKSYTYVDTSQIESPMSCFGFSSLVRVNSQIIAVYTENHRESTRIK
jgi:hypothetical protein